MPLAYRPGFRYLFGIGSCCPNPFIPGASNVPSLYPYVLTLRLTAPTAAAVQTAARDRGLTRAAFIRDALTAALRGSRDRLDDVSLPVRSCRKAKPLAPVDTLDDVNLPTLDELLPDVEKLLDGWNGPSSR